MSEFIYRFRSIEKLLGLGLEFKEKELENQSIYFCPPNELNDPLENFKDIVWQGDKILWSNLLKNYLLCLYRVHWQIQIWGETKLLRPEDIEVFSTYDKLPPQKKDNTRKLFEEFFQNEKVKHLIEGLSTRENVRRDELLYYLAITHKVALSLINKQDDSIKESKKDLGDILKSSKSPLCPSEFFRKINQIKTKTDVEHPEEKIFLEGNLLSQQVKTLFTLKTDKNKKNEIFYLYDFPKLYIRQVEEILFYPWYTACFSNTVSNSSMWGHYAEGHKGVCLKFKTTRKNNSRGIFLRTITGRGRCDEYGNKFFPLYKINYEAKIKPVNFFRSIGRPPYPDLIHWYTEDGKNPSPLVQDLLKNSNEEWRKSYWEIFYENIRIKTKDWKHEKERRLILSSLLSGNVSEERVLKYSFKDLDGIIFGINTSEDHKLEIIKIIEDICQKEKRSDFNFYQASYNSFSGKIDTHPLNLIKITETTTEIGENIEKK